MSALQAARFGGCGPPLEPLKELDVWLNSGGGSAQDGLTLYTLLRQRATCSTIQKLCASTAFMLALAAPNVSMDKDAFIGLHAASGACLGTAKELRATAEAKEEITGFITC